MGVSQETKIQHVLIFMCILAIPQCVLGEKILFFFGLSTYSHRITAWPLATKLAERGHSVTFLQAIKNKTPHPNITDIYPKGVEIEAPPNFVDLRVNYGRNMIYPLTLVLPSLGVAMCSQFLHAPENIEWVKSEKFDLVIVDAFFNDCAYGLAWKWNAKTVVFTPGHVFDWFPDIFGFPDESATAPSIQFEDNLPLGFFGRVMSQVSYLYYYFNREFGGIRHIEPMLRDKLDIPEMPPVTDLMRNTSLVLLNSHFSEELPRSLPPLMVSVGGMHVSEEVHPLPKELAEFVAGSGENGFIYVSFGSEADMAKSPDYIKEIFWNVLKRSKVRFLWKWDGPRPKGMPENVLTSNWMPQQDVLGHPKCMGFITHGGLLSMQEAVSRGVPMIAFPIFAEQDYNSERLQRTGRGIRLEIGKLTESDLESAINRLLNDPSLKQNMDLASIRFKDRPAKPVDTAVWWVEYALRHQDTASFLRPSAAISLTWYQRRQLDVWAFLTIFTIIYVYISWKIVRAVFGLVYSSFKRKSLVTSSEKKKK